MMLSGLSCNRDLELVRLSGLGLHRLGVTRKQLIEAEASEYPATREWALALYKQTECDGLLWKARQNDEATAIVLFGSRVPSADLFVSTSSISLFYPPGLDWVRHAASEADITIVL